MYSYMSRDSAPIIFVKARRNGVSIYKKKDDLYQFGFLQVMFAILSRLCELRKKNSEMR